jgi:soluble lytic murein transglycosylase-like protein
MNILGPQNTGNMLQQAQSQAAEMKLQQLSENATSKSELEGLEKAAKEFEAVFMNSLLKAMRKTVPDNKLFNSEGPTKFYQQMQDAEMAKGMAAGHNRIGIAEMIVRQFKNNVEGEGNTNIEPTHPPVSTLPPEAMQRYRSMGQATGQVADLVRLRSQARQQGTAVADTLQRFEQEITQSARQNGLDPALVLAVVMEESGGDPMATSGKGAQGLMQLMPQTARELGVDDPTSPSQNVAGGSLYLSRMLNRYDGDLELALAAYNAGPGNVDRAGGKVPDFKETQSYVKKVQERFKGLGGTIMANQQQSRPLKTSSGEMP